MRLFETPSYARAFRAYLRRGTPIALTLKADRTSEKYIWRTMGDSKVRADHAANEGKIFSWDSPPPTGQPGENYNCRCWAEPVEDDYYTRQTLIMAIKDSPEKWSNAKLTERYLSGDGTGVTLSEIG